MLSDSSYLLAEDAILDNCASRLCWVVIEEKKLMSLSLSSVRSVSEDTVRICGSSTSYIIGCENIQEHIKVRGLKITVSK